MHIMIPRTFLATVAVFLLSAPLSRASEGLADTPPMGWNSWNKFGCNVSDRLIRETADAVVSTGMRDAGYSYVIIDDCWQVGRDSAGRIEPDPERFPAGMKALADYVHSKGLKFGIYSDAGTETCGGRPGSKGHEEQDAQAYASWGVDYLKYDWCKTEGMDAHEAYLRMSRALKATGRSVVFSLCEWGTSKPWLWAEGIGQLWRATGDIQDCWECSRSWGGMGASLIIELVADLYPYAGPGHWNDPDMLEVGNGGMTTTEYVTHFSFWTLLSAPLIAGNDLRQMSKETVEILTNREVIAVDQDTLGIQGRRLKTNGPHEVWMKPLSDGSRAVILYNRGTEAGVVSVDFGDLGLAPLSKGLVRDLWKKVDLGTSTGSFKAKVEPHGVVMVRVTPVL